jgi:choline dehydrogenase-like flavoprotein
MSEQWDVIIAGGGTTGCLMAGRLSEDPKLKVLLIEAGPNDSSPFIRLPKGMLKLWADPRHIYLYLTEWISYKLGGNPEALLRGRGLGGSSKINGMLFLRGQPEDYDGLAAMGLRGWSWQEILPCFRGLEDNPLGETEWRGRGGAIPLHVAKTLPPFAEAIMTAAQALGLPRKEEPNLPKQLGISPSANNIDRRGERISAAGAFLTPAVRRRPNLRILVESRLDRVLFEGRRAVGVVCTRGGAQEEYRASREVVLCLGPLESPRLLQISGVGPAQHLSSLGIQTVVDSPGVGAHYRDRFGFTAMWRLRHQRDSENREYRGWRLVRNVLRYYAFRNGPMSRGVMQVVAFPEVLPGNTGRADAEILYAPFSCQQMLGTDKGIILEDEPGYSVVQLPLRPTSEGSVMAQSADPAVPPLIRPGYLLTDYDRALTICLIRFVRRLMAQPALAPYVVGELGEGPKAQSDDEIIDFVSRMGQSAYQSIGTCKMGIDGDKYAVLDERLRVRGVSGLRVVDCSVLPAHISANICGPIMAIAWRATDMMREDLACRSASTTSRMS